MADSILDDVYGGPGGAPSLWPGERDNYISRSARNNAQDIMWDVARGDPNAGYQIKLPDWLASARKSVMDTIAPVSQVLNDSGAGLALGFLAPVSQAAFMTPMQISRLEAAGRVRPGGWGSKDALSRAHERWAKGDMDTWGETGWAHRGTYEPGAESPLIREPVTWVDTSDISIRPEVMSTINQRLSDSGGAAGTHSGPVAHMLQGEGLDTILAASPQLADNKLSLGLVRRNPMGDAAYPKGGVLFKEQPSRGNLGEARRTTPGDIEAYGPDVPSLMDVLSHELRGHAVPGAGGMVSFAPRDVPGPPISGVAAESKIGAHHAHAWGRAKAAREAGNDAEYQRLRNVSEHLDEARWNASGLAGYMANPYELLAREAMMRNADPSLARVPPGQVDVYAPEAWPGGKANMDITRYGVQLRDYAPPGSRYTNKGD